MEPHDLRAGRCNAPAYVALRRIVIVNLLAADVGLIPLRLDERRNADVVNVGNIQARV